MSSAEVQETTGRMVCPYCKSEVYGDPNEYWSGDEDANDFGDRSDNCPHCDKVFAVQVEVVYTTTPDCTLNGESHLLHRIDATSGVTLWACEKCGFEDTNEGG